MTTTTTTDLKLGPLPVTGRVLLVAGLCLGLVGGLLAWLVVGTTYTATASVLVRPVSAQPFTAADATKQLSMKTELRVASSDGLAAQITDAVGISAAQLSNNLSVSNPAETTLLNFSYTSTDPEVAAAAANAFAVAYLADRSRRTKSTVDTVSTALQRELDSLDKQIAALAKQLPGAKAPQQGVINAEISALVGQTVEINGKQVDLQSLDASPGEIVAKAVPPASPGTPSLFTWLFLGAVAGLALGILLIWLRPSYEPFLRRRSKDRADMSAAGADPSQDGAAAPTEALDSVPGMAASN